MIRILFFGSSDYCLPVLESLNKNFNLVGVLTRLKSPVKQFALSHNIKVFTPEDKSELLALKKDLEKLQPDLAVVSDYGIIIPKEIFTIPHHQTLNIHFSKLPKYRGPSPVQYTILNGEKSAWITIILMDETMDTGDILWRQEVGPLDGSETTPDLYRKLFSIAAQELPGVIDKYSQKQLKPIKQLNSLATYTKSFTRADGFVPFSQFVKLDPASPAGRQSDKLSILIERKIRALSPWPGVWTTVNIPQPKRLKLLKSHIESNKLVLDEVQLEGKKPVTWKQFLEGYPNCY